MVANLESHIDEGDSARDGMGVDGQPVSINYFFLLFPM